MREINQERFINFEKLVGKIIDSLKKDELI